MKSNNETTSQSDSKILKNKINKNKTNEIKTMK